MTVARYSISGMSCVNCAARIEKALRDQDGVQRGTVNFATSELTVEFDDTRLAATTIEELITSLGYGVRDAGGPGDESASELRRERQWLTFSLALSLPIMATMGLHDRPAIMTMSFVLAAVVQFTAGLTFYRSAWYSLRSGSANMDVLVASGTTAAFGCSVVAYFTGWHEGVFFETSAMLIAFIRLGKYLEARARGVAGAALRALLDLQPATARLVQDGTEREVPAASVMPGDLLLVRPGESFPVDGVIVSGETTADESLVTGESLPCFKGTGAEVTGSTINLTGAVRMRASRVGDETTMARIVRMVREAQSDKAPIQRLADRISARFVPAVLLLSLATFAVWYLCSDYGFVFALKLAIAVVVIACPCAMGLATPTAIMVGSGVGLARGILFRKGSVLERVAGVDLVILDKTGTITAGAPRLQEFRTADGVSEELFMEQLAAASSQSLHPLARAVSAAAAARQASPGTVDRHEERQGAGAIVSYRGSQLLIGSRRLLEESGVEVSPLSGYADGCADQGFSTVWLAADGRLAGVAACVDPVKESSAGAVAALQQMGIRCIMVTGDSRGVAAAVAGNLRLDGFEAEVLPERKQHIVRAYQAQGHIVGMVGDGINDAPAIAAADVGIAIGSGTDVAKETGDIILVRSSLMDVVHAIRLGKATLAKIRQNLFWALCYNAAGIPVAAGVLYPAAGITLKPEYAGLAMALSSVSVVLNSLLLRRFAGSMKDDP